MFLKCYRKGNDFFEPIRVDSLDEVRDTDRFKEFMSFYSPTRRCPMDRTRFLAYTKEESYYLDLDAEEMEVLNMNITVSPDPLIIMVCSLISRLECIDDDYREKSEYLYSLPM